MGPFELMDFIGLDVNFAVSASLYQQTHQEPRFRPHLLQETLVRSGCLGRKSGQGFYDYASAPRKRPRCRPSIFLHHLGHGRSGPRINAAGLWLGACSPR
jgi:3-hydroxyacyl-CoA dehydrogenase